MLIFFAIMAAGFGAGLLLRAWPRPVAWAGALTRPVIFALLFLMGLGIGLDDGTMANLGALGLSSLGFAVVTIAGSMAVLGLVLPFLRPPPGRGTIPPDAADAADILAAAAREGEALGK